MIRRFGLIALLCLPLAACGEPSDAERAALKSALPDGCKFYEVGSYGGIRDLVFIRCDGRATTTSFTHWVQSHGKSSSDEYSAAFVIEGNAP